MISSEESNKMAQEIANQTRKGVRVNKQAVDQISKSLNSMFEKSSKIQKIKILQKMEINNKKKDNRSHLRRVQRKEMRQLMGLPLKRLGDTMEYGKSTTNRKSRNTGQTVPSNQNSTLFPGPEAGELSIEDQKKENDELDLEINQQHLNQNTQLSLSEIYENSLVNQRINNHVWNGGISFS